MRAPWLLEAAKADRIDWPGTWHDMANGFAFAGHSEIHKWIDSRTRVKNPTLYPPRGSLAASTGDGPFLMPRREKIERMAKTIY